MIKITEDVQSVDVLDKMEKELRNKTIDNAEKVLLDLFEKDDVVLINNPVKHYIIKHGKKHIIVIETENADKADKVVGKLSIGYLK